MRLGVLEVRDALTSDTIGTSVLFHVIGADPVDPSRIQTEDLRAQRRRDLGIAIHRAQFGGDLESAKRLDLILRRAVPDRVGAPEHVVLAAVLEELAERMRRARRARA